MSRKILIIFVILLLTANVNAKTSVPEELTADAVWTKSDSPYEIEKDFKILHGVTLTIEPGVKVIFKDHRKTQPSDVDQRIKFVVRGRLIANGTSEEKIIFSSSEPLLGLWAGIVFENTQDNKSIIENCQIERARCGISCYKSSPIINNNYFAKNELAIDCEDWSSPTITNNTFTDNGANPNSIGVIYCARYSSPRIKNNLIDKNVGSGIGISTFSSPEISQNTIIYNTSHGIYISSFSEPVIFNNDIGYNGCFGQQGVAISQASPTVMGNYIHNNCKIGISVSFNSSPVISGNRIVDNEIGIICVSSSPVLMFNVIKDFQEGIIVSGNSFPTINYNNFGMENKLTSCLKLENCSQQINAQSNWWNTAKPSEIESLITDGSDDPILGAVVFKPFLNSEVTLNDYLNINMAQFRKVDSDKISHLKNDSILFLSYRDGNWEIYSADSNAGEIKNLTNNPGIDISPCWSPDSKEIAFSSNRSGNQEIYIMSASGTNIQKLTDNIFNDAVPVWSPDGKRIAYLSEIRHVFVINRDGSDKKSIDLNTYAKSLPGFFLSSYLWIQDN